MNKTSKTDKTLLCVVAASILGFAVTISEKADAQEVAYIHEWNESSQYGRLSCKDFRAPIMVYRKETGKKVAILGGGWWRYGFTMDGKPSKGCIVA